MTALPGAGQTNAQTPQPVHCDSTIRGRPDSTAMAPGTGQRSAQTLQNEPFHARHDGFMMVARAIASGRSRRSTAGSHASMHGVPSHITQGETLGSIIGVPAASR